MDTVDSQQRTIALRISVLARNLRSAFDRKVCDIGVTRSQWQLIAVVARKPGVTQRVIAEALEISEASAGRLIDRLCADGMLERRERERDRRARAVYLTHQSEPLMARLSDIAAENETLMFQGISQKELDQLECILGRIHRNLAQSSDSGQMI